MRFDQAVRYANIARQRIVGSSANIFRYRTGWGVRIMGHDFKRHNIKNEQDWKDYQEDRGIKR